MQSHIHTNFHLEKDEAMMPVSLAEETKAPHNGIHALLLKNCGSQ